MPAGLHEEVPYSYRVVIARNIDITPSIEAAQSPISRAAFFFLFGLFVQVVVVKYPKKDNSAIPVWRARALVCLRGNGDAVMSIDPNGPSGRVIDDPLEVQPGVKGIFLKKGQGFEYLPLNRPV
jgi:hypothetical protein